MTEVDPASENAEPVAPPPAVPPPVPDEERPLNSDGRERPRFLLKFPDDPELQRLVRAFEAGNYEAVRDGADKLAESTADPLVREAARELRRRIDPDPLLKYLLSVAVLLFVLVVWYTYQGQSH
jgi:hypothetical protein